MLGRTSELWNVTGRRQRAPEMASRCDSGAVLSLLYAAFAASQVVNSVAGKYIKVECFAGITVLFVADGKGLRSFTLSRDTGKRFHLFSQYSGGERPAGFLHFRGAWIPMQKMDKYEENINFH